MPEKESVKYSFQPKLEYILIRDPSCIKMNAKNIDEWTKPSYERCKQAVGIIFVVILPHISNNMIRTWIGPTPSTEEFASLLELTRVEYDSPPPGEKKFTQGRMQIYGPFLLFRHNIAMIRYHLTSFVCIDSPQNVVEIVQFILYHHWNSMSFHFL